MDISNKTISTFLWENASAIPDNDAFIFTEQNIRYSWRELNTRVNRFSKALLANDIYPGDHIAIWATNIPEWVITQFAAARIGAVLVTINPEWKSEELKYALNQSDTKCLVMMPGFTKKTGAHEYRYDYIDMIQAICPGIAIEDVCKELLPNLQILIQTTPDPKEGFKSWLEVIEDGNSIPDQRLNELDNRVKCTDPVMVQYTSGTTGFPKGAILTHQNVVNNALAVGRNLNFSNTDRLCGPVPFYHCFGSILVNMVCLVNGATSVIPCPVFDAEQTLAAVEKEKCTAIHGVPTMFIAELENSSFSQYNLSSLRTGIIAGAPVEKELFEAVTEVMGVKEMTIAYGLTEASPVTHQTLITDSKIKRYTTVGRPLEGSHAKIMDPESLTELAIGKVGEIWVKGFHVMQGYYRREKETNETIQDGWLRTGDLAKKDVEGYYTIVGRLKNMIIVGGHNVYPAEVEQNLFSILGHKAEILQVVGLPHPKWQEVVGLAVKLKPNCYLTLSEIRLACIGKMEWPKIPRYLVVMDDFSELMTVSGKIQKFKLKEYMIERINSSVIPKTDLSLI